MTSSKKLRIAAVGLGMATLALSHSTFADMTYFVNQGGFDAANRDIDFATSSVPTATNGVLAGLKYWKLDLQTSHNQAQCFEVWTGGDGTGDTRFWVYDINVGDYVHLNDDSDGSTLYAKARVWLVPNAEPDYEPASITVTGWSTYYNSMKFELNVKKFPGSTTEAQCTQGSTLKHIHLVQTVVGAT
jgi:hypothetical protein